MQIPYFVLISRDLLFGTSWSMFLGKKGRVKEENDIGKQEMQHGGAAM